MDGYKEITKSTYDDIADEYADRDSAIIPETSEVAKDREYFMSLLPKNAHILDIGCGAGRDDQYFIAQDFKITGIDISEPMVDWARKINPQAEYSVMDLENLDFKKESFDAVWANASLHHIPKDKLGPVIAKIQQLLKPEGVFCLKVKAGLGESFVEDSNFNKKITRYFAFYIPEELSGIITSFGFKIILIKKSVADKWLDIFVQKN